ncbi:MAG: two-component hybrid sensor and regulator [Myxococcaceae bacterium]|nr:two-component hybrid sensor and regulator [Myxococcaceae bacterium]
MSDEDKQVRANADDAAQQSDAVARDREELSRLRAELEEQTRTLELLNATGAMVATSLDLESVVQAVTDAGTRLSGAQFGAFFYTVTNPEGVVLQLYTLSGAPRSAFEKFAHPRATPVFAPTFRGEAVVRLHDVRADPRYGQIGPYFGMPPGHLPVRSYLAVPVVARSGEVLGGLFFGHEQAGVFTERAERLLIGVAAQAAIAVDNARLYEAAKRSSEDRARLLEAERAARAEVERVSLLKDEFLATLSHELRTPLHAILGWSELLLSRLAPNDSSQQRGLETIARNARTQAKLIEDLLDMSRIMSGKLRFDVRSVEVSTVLEGALEAVQSAATTKSIRIVKHIDPALPVICADEGRLQQIVLNLLGNAVKFTPTGGNVELRAHVREDQLEIVVRDDGVGISSEFLPYMFERFRQADSSSTRRYGGLGLGLAIVKQLVELHGGSVAVDSEGVGHGAAFTLRIPLARSTGAEKVSLPAQAESSIGMPNEAVSLDRVRVLVVDDEHDARELLRHVLSDVGAEVHCAASAHEGLAMVQSLRPNLLISDIGMPDRDGHQLMQDVRRLTPEAGGAVKAIALTAFARAEDEARAYRAGYDLHIGKPYEPHELLLAARALVGRQ